MIIAIVGPTGIGKSSLALKIAKQTSGEIVNCDAFQIYKKLDIGTAKPSLEERKIVPHHLFDFVEVDYPFSIYDYQKILREKIDELKGKNVPIILVGGTGLYLKSSLYDFNLSENKNLIDMSEYEKMDNQTLHNILEKLDYEESLKIHQNNRKRVLRAIEICLSQGKKKSEIINEQEHKLLYDVTFIGLIKPREELNEIINKRVDLMFDMGLLDEVKNILKNYPKTCHSLQAIGYKEIIDGLENYLSLDEIKEKIKLNSRRYAKRQMTYFKHQLNVNWFNSIDEAYDYVMDLYKKERN